MARKVPSFEPSPSSCSWAGLELPSPLSSLPQLNAMMSEAARSTFKVCFIILSLVPALCYRPRDHPQSHVQDLVSILQFFSSPESGYKHLLLPQDLPAHLR